MKCFKNILIPVDLTLNTELAIKKALELIDPESIIHLLYVRNKLSVTLRYILDPEGQDDLKNINEKLNEWKNRIEDSTKEIKVCTWIMLGNHVQDTIAQKAIQLNVDLIIIGKHSHHSWFPFLNTVFPGKLAQSTQIPVLTVKPGSVNNRIRTIIVPVAIENPAKIDTVIAISKKFPVKIYLVSFVSKNIPANFYATALLQMYQRLKTLSNCPVEYAVLHGNNKARAILEYAMKVDADILLLQPGLETKVGWPSKYISDLLPADSKVQILAL